MKDRNEALRRKIEGCLRKEQLSKNEDHKRLEGAFLTKSRKNFSVANLLFRISEQADMKRLLKLAPDSEMYDWVIVISYYSMYTSSLSALAKLGYKSKSHAATIAVLEYSFVRDKKLETNDIHKLVNAYALSGQLITKLIQTKTKREAAQYDATPSITREMAKTALNDADEFITKIEEILS